MAGNFGFVSYGNGLAVMNTAKSPPQTIHRIPLASAQGEALTLGNNYLLVSGGSGAAVFKVSDLIRGKTHPLKLLNSPGGRYAVEVAVTPDGRFAFITLQHSNQVAVFDLFRALASRAYRSTPVRKVGVGPNPIGIAAAPDGSYLYVATGLGDNCKTSAEGSLVVLDAATAEGKAPGPLSRRRSTQRAGWHESSPPLMAKTCGQPRAAATPCRRTRPPNSSMTPATHKSLRSTWARHPWAW